MFGAEIDHAIRAHALAEYPKECCGLVSGGVYVPLRNEARDPLNHFQLQVSALVEHAPVQAIIHSHCGPWHGKELSPGDRENQRHTRIPVYGLVWTDGNIACGPDWFGDGIDERHPSANDCHDRQR